MRQRSDDLLEKALITCSEAQKLANKKEQPEFWADVERLRSDLLETLAFRNNNPKNAQAGLDAARRASDALSRSTDTPVVVRIKRSIAAALVRKGELEKSVDDLNEAKEILETLIGQNSPEDDELDDSQNSLVICLRWLGVFSTDVSHFIKAEKISLDLIGKSGDTIPFNTAITKWNLADLLLARFEVDPDPAHLDKAEDHATQAREVFLEGSDYQTDRADKLLAKIAEARAAA